VQAVTGGTGTVVLPDRETLQKSPPKGTG